MNANSPSPAPRDELPVTEAAARADATIKAWIENAYSHLRRGLEPQSPVVQDNLQEAAIQIAKAEELGLRVAPYHDCIAALLHAANTKTLHTFRL